MAPRGYTPSTSGTASSMPQLRDDPRVVVMERTHIRELETLPETPDTRDDRRFVHLADAGAADVLALLRPAAQIVALVKPQFEAGKAK